MMMERYKLAAGRIRQIPEEESVREPFRTYFREVSEFLLMLLSLEKEIGSGDYEKLSMEQLKEWNQRLYEDILPGKYERSYANPAYAAAVCGMDMGRILSFLYTEKEGQEKHHQQKY